MNQLRKSRCFDQESVERVARRTHSKQGLDCPSKRPPFHLNTQSLSYSPTAPLETPSCGLVPSGISAHYSTLMSSMWHSSSGRYCHTQCFRCFVELCLSIPMEVLGIFDILQTLHTNHFIQNRDLRFSKSLFIEVLLIHISFQSIYVFFSNILNIKK